jgi:hypothetical protein
MKRIGERQGFTIYWSDPRSDGGRGTGEVKVGADSAGKAQSESEAMRMAEQFISHYKNKS